MTRRRCKCGNGEPITKEGVCRECFTGSKDDKKLRAEDMMCRESEIARCEEQHGSSRAEIITPSEIRAAKVPGGSRSHKMQFGRRAKG